MPAYLIKTGTTFFFTSTPGDYTVRFYDYDGRLLKSQGVTAGRDATAPALPAHEGLTFDTWNQTFTNVQRNMDVGAIYETSDGKTHAKLRITTVTGLSTTLYLNKSDGSTLSVDWGDGTTSTFANTGNFNTGAHVYPALGDYTIKIWISSGTGTYGFGSGGSLSSFCGGGVQIVRDQLISIFVGANVTMIGQSAYRDHRALKSAMLPDNIESIGAYAFMSCYSVFVLLPNSVSNIKNTAFYQCFASARVRVSIPSSVSVIETDAFRQCFGSYQFFPTTPPTIGTAVFAGILASAKIYVPDASVAAYKAATNWITWADYIYPVSEMP